MMILTLIKTQWRKKYCVPFFCFAIIEAFHTFPATLINDSAFLVVLFMVACALLLGMGIWGLQTKRTYDEDPAKAEKYFFIQYLTITIVNASAAVLELPNILTAFSDHSKNGVWTNYGDEPHRRVGHTVYDMLPEKVGMTIFVVFAGAVWFIWPLYLLAIKKPNASKMEGVVGETTPLTSFS
jgi:hypothetical protein